MSDLCCLLVLIWLYCGWLSFEFVCMVRCGRLVRLVTDCICDSLFGWIRLFVVYWLLIWDFGLWFCLFVWSSLFWFITLRCCFCYLDVCFVLYYLVCFLCCLSCFGVLFVGYLRWGCVAGDCWLWRLVGCLRNFNYAWFAIICWFSLICDWLLFGIWILFVYWVLVGSFRSCGFIVEDCCLVTIWGCFVVWCLLFVRGIRTCFKCLTWRFCLLVFACCCLRKLGCGYCFVLLSDTWCLFDLF